MGKFIRKKEDFICENCGEDVKGTGYTNHCPKCLFSRHVDINPGDRMEKCQGMMEPVDAETNKDLNYVVLRCLKCGHIKRNKLSKNDSFETFLDLSKKQVEKFKLL
ncbi:MAG: RNHCP domain-containing protein [Patescibacteria group bacterium]